MHKHAHRFNAQAMARHAAVQLSASLHKHTLMQTHSLPTQCHRTDKRRVDMHAETAAPTLTQAYVHAAAHSLPHCRESKHASKLIQLDLCSSKALGLHAARSSSSSSTNSSNSSNSTNSSDSSNSSRRIDSMEHSVFGVLCREQLTRHVLSGSNAVMCT